MIPGFFAAYPVSYEPPPAGFPSLLSVTISNFDRDQPGGEGSDHHVQMPETVGAGDLMVVAFVVDGGSDLIITAPIGWTLLATSFQSNGTSHFAIYYKVSNGTEGGTTVNWATSVNESAMAHVFQYQSGTYQGAPEYSVSPQAGTSSFSVPSLSPSWGNEKSAWIVGLGVTLNHTVNSWPLADNQNATIGGAQNNARVSLYTCTQEVETGTLSPPDFVLSGISHGTVYTISIHPA